MKENNTVEYLDVVKIKNAVQGDSLFRRELFKVFEDLLQKDEITSIEKNKFIELMIEIYESFSPFQRILLLFELLTVVNKVINAHQLKSEQIPKLLGLLKDIDATLESSRMSLHFIYLLILKEKN